MARRAKPAILEELDHAERLDARLRDITNERDANRAQINGISKDVATMRRNKDESGADAVLRHGHSDHHRGALLVHPLRAQHPAGGALLGG